MASNRIYLHRYRIKTGPYAGFYGDGVQIGVQDYLDQIEIEKMTHSQVQNLWKDKFDRGLGEGIWLFKLGVAVHPQIVKGPVIQIDEEGAHYYNDYVDFCVPFDRHNREIFVGDHLYASIKGEVRQVEVKKIAAKPYMANYGIMNRKLTVYDAIEDQTLTINDPRSTIKDMLNSPSADSETKLA